MSNFSNVYFTFDPKNSQWVPTPAFDSLSPGSWRRSYGSNGNGGVKNPMQRAGTSGTQKSQQSKPANQLPLKKNGTQQGSQGCNSQVTGNSGATKIKQQPVTSPAANSQSTTAPTITNLLASGNEALLKNTSPLFQYFQSLNSASSSNSCKINGQEIKSEKVDFSNSELEEDGQGATNDPSSGNISLEKEPSTSKTKTLGDNSKSSNGTLPSEKQSATSKVATSEEEQLIQKKNQESPGATVESSEKSSSEENKKLGNGSSPQKQSSINSEQTSSQASLTNSESSGKNESSLNGSTSTSVDGNNAYGENSEMTDPKKRKGSDSNSQGEESTSKKPKVDSNGSFGQTFLQSWSSSRLQVAISCNNYPVELMTKESFTRFEDEIDSLILSLEEEGPDKIPILAFKEGTAVFYCENEASKDWLVKLLNSDKLQKSFDLKILEEDDIPGVMKVIALYEKEIEPQKALVMLSKMNAGLDTRRWIIQR